MKHFCMPIKLTNVNCHDAAFHAQIEYSLPHEEP